MLLLIARTNIDKITEAHKQIIDFVCGRIWGSVRLSPSENESQEEERTADATFA